MSIIPSNSSRQMENNKFSVQYSDETITKKHITGARGNLFPRGLKLLVHFQISLGFRLLVASLMWLLLMGSLG